MNVDLLPIELQSLRPIIHLYYPGQWSRDPLPQFLPKLSTAVDYMKTDEIFQHTIEQSIQRGHEQFTSFQFDVRSLTADANFQRGWQFFREELIENSQAVIRLLSLAVHAALVEGYQLVIDHPILVGLYDSDSVVKLSELNVSMLDKFITITGRIVSTENVIPLPSILHFECSACGQNFPVLQPFGRFTKPSSCFRQPLCPGTNFQLLHNARGNKYNDARWVTIQELFTGKGDEKDKVPMSFQILALGSQLYREFEIVIAAGMMMARVADSKKSSSFHEMYIFGSAIITKAERFTQNELELSDQDITLFRSMARTPGNFARLCNSIKTSISGMSDIKSGLLLALLGGAENKGGRRSTIHVLICGDPGTGKSKLLEGVLELATNGELVVGTTISGPGLTMTVTKSSTGYEIRTGAIIRASNGVLCIDEFDKMNKEIVNYLLEAMAQQVCSIAKASVSRRLTAKVSVIAVSNPTDSFYNPSLTFAKNLKIKEALLNRFDLIYVTMDTPNAERDGNQVKSFISAFPALAPLSHHLVATTQQDMDDEEPNEMQSSEPPLEPRILSKYIAYAKSHCCPVLEPAAKSYILESYLRLKSQAPPSRIISTRQLEALLRLTEARAKADLTNIATLSHARQAVKIYMIGFKGTLSGPEANIRLSNVSLTSSLPIRNRSSTGRSQRQQELSELNGILETRAGQKNSRIFTRNTIAALVRVHRFRTDPNTLIELLNNRGIILSTSDTHFRLT